jgi:hypothetical protein
LNPKFSWGGRGTLGYRWDNQAVEISGFYLPQTSVSHITTNPGRIDLPFINAPVGFEGDNGLWLQADRTVMTLQTTLGNAEFNYRFSPSAGMGLDLLAGIRYLDLRDRFSILTDDDGLTVMPVNPTTIATYTDQVHNHILAFQLGADWEYPLRRWVAFGFFAKGAWGANFLDADVSLTRGDGLVGIDAHTNRTVFSHLYETGFFLDWYLGDRARLRTGYNAMWVVDVASGPSQLNFDLSNPFGALNTHSSIFYHGPVVELHFLF